MEPVRADDGTAAAFARDGVACVRQVLDDGEAAAAAAAIDAVLARPSPLAQVASGAGDPGAFVEDFCRSREIPIAALGGGVSGARASRSVYMT